MYPQSVQTTWLDALSDEYRLLLLLVADEELSYDEIAALIGQSTDAVRGKLHRARKAFAAYFEKQDSGSPLPKNGLRSHP